MITFCSINDLEEVSGALKNLSKNFPSLYEKLEEMVYLTRALNIKFQYMGAILMDENPKDFTPNLHESVLRLYHRELQNLKDNHDFSVLKEIIVKYEDASFTNICLLIKGLKPKALVGPILTK